MKPPKHTLRVLLDLLRRCELGWFWGLKTHPRFWGVKTHPQELLGPLGIPKSVGVLFYGPGQSPLSGTALHSSATSAMELFERFDIQMNKPTNQQTMTTRLGLWLLPTSHYYYILLLPIKYHPAITTILLLF